MTYISAEIRRLVAELAGRRCEYCLIHEDDTFLGCEVDHIISKKHGGSNEPENLRMPVCFVIATKEQILALFTPTLAN